MIAANDYHKEFGVRDRHWTSYDSLCHFCSIEYSFIGKLESITQDAAWMLNSFGLDNIVLELVGILIWAQVTTSTVFARSYFSLVKGAFLRLIF